MPSIPVSTSVGAASLHTQKICELIHLPRELMVIQSLKAGHQVALDILSYASITFYIIKRIIFHIAAITIQPLFSVLPSGFLKIDAMEAEFFLFENQRLQLIVHIFISKFTI